MGVFDRIFGNKSKGIDSERLYRLIIDLTQSQDRSSAKRILESHSELLSNDADSLIGQLIFSAISNNDVKSKHVFELYRELLRQCRKIGIAMTFADKSFPLGQSPPTELQLMIQELSRTARPADLPRRIMLCQKGIDFANRDQNRELWAALQVEIGNYLCQNPFRNRADNIEQAIDHYNEALKVYAQKDFPQEWATTQNNLAVAFSNRIMGDRADNIEQAIHHYNEALRVRTQNGLPQDWATTQNNLAVAFSNRIMGDRADNIEQAIHHYNEALKIRTEKDLPQDWAATQNDMGLTYSNRIMGDRADNIEQAIHHYNEALNIRTEKDLPQDWAATQDNLANAYNFRIKGDRADNIEQAINHYNEALKIRTENDLPQDWAATQNNLAAAYWNRIKGDRADNIEQAINHYNEALKIRTEKDLPRDWAMTQNNLAVAFSGRIRGHRADNIEQAINHYNEALKIRTEKGLPQDWAATQNNLANSYCSRIKGDRADNIEQAINHYNEALKINAQNDLHHDWAANQNGLGLAYSNRIKGDRADNIEQAINHYNEALKVYIEDKLPQDWAMTQNNLAIAYGNRISGDLADNVDKSIHHLKEALKVYIEEDLPHQWAMTQNNLAVAYINCIKGDRVDNIEQAIHHFNEALKVYIEEDLPHQWAMTQNNLAVAFSNRIMGDRADNIEQAIHHYNEALKIRTEKDLPQDWAATQDNLAAAYWNRIKGGRSDNIEQAIHHYNEALKVRTEKDLPQDWAATQNNLAAAYMDRIKGDRADNIEQAIHHYNEALKIRTEKDLPQDWALTQNNLANAYRDRIMGDREDNIEQAINHYHVALKLFSPESFPNKCRTTARSLGNLYFERIRWREAADIYKVATKAAERLYQASIFRSSREKELGETGDLYRRAAYCLAKSDQLPDAVVLLEQGRARGLSEALARDRANIDRAKLLDPEAYNLFRNAAEIIRSLEFSEEKGGSILTEGKTRARPNVLRDQAIKAHTDFVRAIDRVRHISGYDDFLKEADWDDITRAVTRDQPLVYLVTTFGGGLALIISRSKGSGSQDFLIEPIWLEKFTEDHLWELLNAPLGVKEMRGWFGAYSYWLGRLWDEKARDLWLETILKVTDDLWQGIMEAVVSHIASMGFDKAFLLPSGYLALLPLHAASWEEDGRRHYAMEKVSFAYAPSARSLAHARHIAESTPSKKLLAIDEPKTTKSSPLPNSQAEVKSISDLFYEPKVLRHAEAEKSDVMKALKDAQVAHFSCHGSVNWDNPENSGVLMARDEMLTIQDLFELNLEGARMVTLSACETGIIGAKLPDEVIALPSAFMRAGFAGVVACLWSVSELSTSILMSTFYRLWIKEGYPAAEALRRAQMQLRKDELFEHPFYWAGFYLTGV